MATKKKAPAGTSGPQRNTSGNGGETHQQATAKTGAMTTAQGIPVADNQNSLRAFPRGPTLLEDFILREKITHFDHERIPERIVHARGSAAHGYFELTKPLAKFTGASTRILPETADRLASSCCVACRKACTRGRHCS